MISILFAIFNSLNLFATFVKIIPIEYFQAFSILIFQFYSEDN